MSSDWEVFASILVRDLGKKLAAGIDLSQYEVKSATEGGSYEYQYHKLGGKQNYAGTWRWATYSSTIVTICDAWTCDTRMEIR